MVQVVDHTPVHQYTTSCQGNASPLLRHHAVQWLCASLTPVTMSDDLTAHPATQLGCLSSPRSTPVNAQPTPCLSVQLPFEGWASNSLWSHFWSAYKNWPCGHTIPAQSQLVLGCFN